MTDSFSLYQLNEYLKRVIALNFADPLWITCEISQVNEIRGNYYLDLIQKKEDGDEIIAQSRATIWYKQGLFLSRKLGDWMTEILQQGMEIKCKVEVEFSERYGLNLRIVDVDPAYTVGKMALSRAKIIDRLREENLIDKNGLLDLPPVFQKIAIISSSSAAGLQDFLKHIGDNPYSYTFEIHLFESRMQGQKVSNELCQQLENIQNSKHKFDIVCIVRGGGSKLDLSGFDDYDIGKMIATMSIPVVTGIGHDIDETVTDLVAFEALKTPTAVADFLIEHNLMFESKILNTFEKIQYNILNKFKKEETNLSQHFNQIIQLASRKIADQNAVLALQNQKIRYRILDRLNSDKKIIEIVSSKVELLNPANLLKRGYCVAISHGKRIKSINQIKISESIETILQDGKIISTVNTLNKHR